MTRDEITVNREQTQIALDEAHKRFGEVGYELAGLQAEHQQLQERITHLRGRMNQINGMTADDAEQND